jgi:hypothetical protein
VDPKVPMQEGAPEPVPGSTDRGLVSGSMVEEPEPWQPLELAAGVEGSRCEAVEHEVRLGWSRATYEWTQSKSR